MDPDEDQLLLHSHSVVDLFHSITEAIRFLLSLKENVVENVHLFITKVVNPVITLYIGEIRKSSIHFLATTVSTVDCQLLVDIVKDKTKKHVIQLAITREVNSKTFDFLTFSSFVFN